MEKVALPQPGNRFCLFARRYALHQQHIDTTFHQRQYHMLLAIYNQIHLPIAKTFAVGFFGTVVNACPIRDIGDFGHILFLLSATITQFMWHMLRQFSFRIRMDVIINGLGAYMKTLFNKHAAYPAG